MGVRIFTDAARLSSRGGLAGYQTGRHSGALLKEALSGNFKMMAIYDGTDNPTNPDNEVLDPNVIWMDGSGLYRIGNNFGPTFQNMGQVQCIVAGCAGPRNYGTEEPTEARKDELDPLWQDLATLAPGDVYFVENTIYSLFRFTFTQGEGEPGCVVALSV